MIISTWVFIFQNCLSIYVVIIKEMTLKALNRYKIGSKNSTINLELFVYFKRTIKKVKSTRPNVCILCVINLAYCERLCIAISPLYFINQIMCPPMRYIYVINMCSLMKLC